MGPKTGLLDPEGDASKQPQNGASKQPQNGASKPPQNGASKPPQNDASKPPQNGASKTTSPQRPTVEHIKHYWKGVLADEKAGIRDHCPKEEEWGEPVEKAEKMAQAIMEKGCKREVALQLTLLALYDLVLLVDNSISMGLPENQPRVEILNHTLKQVAGLYTLVSKKYNLESKKGGGIVSVKFLNPYAGTAYGYCDITPGKVDWMIKQVKFRGLTRIGTELQNRILKEYADVKDIKRPLLVVIFTDGEVEGEPNGFLSEVIRSTAAKHEAESKGRAHLISYQFVAIGDDPGARDLLRSLDDDGETKDYIDCLYGEDLDRLTIKTESETNPGEYEYKHRWDILPKLFLGSILPDWDDQSAQPERPPTPTLDVLTVTATDTGDQEAIEEESNDW